MKMRAQPWFAVQEGDAFPEQFETFMSFPKTVPAEIWENFKELHDDLFTVNFGKASKGNWLMAIYQNFSLTQKILDLDMI